MGKAFSLALPDDLESGWRAVLEEQTRQSYWENLKAFLASEWQNHTVYPPGEDIFNAFRYTPLSQVRVVLLGQDPYPNPGQAHGLCFSVPPGVSCPASLRNIFRELHSDLGIPSPSHGCLIPWARQGVLLLNTCLTVRAGQPQSHAGRGWEQFTQAVLQVLNAHSHPLVFLLWGNAAQKAAAGIDPRRHHLLKAPHPSPLSAHQGFFGCRPFSRTNAALEQMGLPPIDWRLPATL
ncbi:MAG: uracil-DNA glycosylase [Thermogemmata sp.]|uniref:Uracil-DNA glycosylase n=1 Tax=Thermogemmata fonticola TaxID=2755323 RepID=A0A7V8VDG4_9BACT|nr:uracil-DNA glycosylase [Thermogemmata fonticola]MBA2225941.1 uracil-DNA glycosylase [Thermogemmata fonticola]GIW85449.1 MAG: uracil-DNA glycosylase [Gemmataceae bacterium]